MLQGRGAVCNPLHVNEPAPLLKTGCPATQGNCVEVCGIRKRDGPVANYRELGTTAPVEFSNRKPVGIVFRVAPCVLPINKREAGKTAYESPPPETNRRSFLCL